MNHGHHLSLPRCVFVAVCRVQSLIGCRRVKVFDGIQVTLLSLLSFWMKEVLSDVVIDHDISIFPAPRGDLHSARRSLPPPEVCSDRGGVACLYVRRGWKRMIASPTVVLLQLPSKDEMSSLSPSRGGTRTCEVSCSHWLFLRDLACFYLSKRMRQQQGRTFFLKSSARGVGQHSSSSYLLLRMRWEKWMVVGTVTHLTIDG